MPQSSKAKQSKQETKLQRMLRQFLNSQQRLADKYGATVSIGTQGNMVEIAKPKK